MIGDAIDLIGVIGGNVVGIAYDQSPAKRVIAIREKRLQMIANRFGFGVSSETNQMRTSNPSSRLKAAYSCSAWLF